MSNRIGQETFVESIELYRTPDVGFYIATGVNALDRVDKWRGTYRLHLDLKNGGVRRELLAPMNARLVQWTQDETGARVGVFGARGRDGHPFVFRLREKDFTNSRKISRTIYSRGGVGCFIMPGCACAFMRAVLHFTEQSEPMPFDEEVIRAQYRDEFEEVDPFDDDGDDVL